MCRVLQWRGLTQPKTCETTGLLQDREWLSSWEWICTTCGGNTCAGRYAKNEGATLTFSPVSRSFNCSLETYLFCVYLLSVFSVTELCSWRCKFYNIVPLPSFLCAIWLLGFLRWQVIEFEDRYLVPLPPPDPLRNYTAAASRGGVDRSDIKPLQISQPEGPSFRVNGYAVEWQKVPSWELYDTMISHKDNML